MSILLGYYISFLIGSSFFMCKLARVLALVADVEAKLQKLQDTYMAATQEKVNPNNPSPNPNFNP